jgi:DhnA family fructose-bisphosphate aldolase class Ia
MSVYPRLRRLLGEDGRCFDVAIDHGSFNERSLLNGIEDMRRAVAMIAEANPDAIQLSPGLAPLLQEHGRKQKPALVLRADVTNVYGQSQARALFSRLACEAVEQALALDAACIVVNLLSIPERAELHEQCIENICYLKPQCVRYGMPLMVEALVLRPAAGERGYTSDGDLDKILPLVRQAVELGADLIKADPCEDVSQYDKVIEVASGCPVLVRGGSKVSDKDLVLRTHQVMHLGAAGIVYGRNVLQHEHPARMVHALMAQVHENATAEQAWKILKG